MAVASRLFAGPASRPISLDPGRISAIVLIALIFAVLGEGVFRSDLLRQSARVLLIAYLALEWRGIQRTGRAMIAVAGALTVAGGVLTADPGAVIGRALDQAAFFATFFANQFFLREPARTSPLVRRSASFFIDQPPARRYGLLTLGGFLFGIILNIGVLSLLGLMIRRWLSAAGGSAAIRAVRERRMVLAVLRGFAVAPLGSPISMVMAVVLSVMPGLSWTTVFPLGLMTAALLLTLGCVQDRLEAPRQTVPVVVTSGARDPMALLGIVGIVMGVFVLAVGIEFAADIPLARAVLVAVPLAGLIWLGWQHRRFGPVRGVRLVSRRLVREGARLFPRYRTEIAVLSSAGFIGTLFSLLIPQGRLAVLLLHLPVPLMFLPGLLTVLVVGLSLIGVNPIVSVTIFASAFQGVPDAGIPAAVLALALMAGWALGVNASPLTASAMIIADMVDRTAREVTRDWNGRYVRRALLLMAVWLAGLTVLLG